MAQNPIPEASTAGSEAILAENVLARLPEKLSTTDPDATWSGKHGFAVLAYYDHYLIDNESCIVLGVEAKPARFSAETAAAKQMITAAKTRFTTRKPRSGQGLWQCRVRRLAVEPGCRPSHSADRSQAANQERIYPR